MIRKKSFRLRILAIILSALLATGSLSMPVLGEQTSENRNAVLLESQVLTDEADTEIKDVSMDDKESETNGDDESSEKENNDTSNEKDTDDVEKDVLGDPYDTTETEGGSTDFDSTSRQTTNDTSVNESDSSEDSLQSEIEEGSNESATRGTSTKGEDDHRKIENEQEDSAQKTTEIIEERFAEESVTTETQISSTSDFEIENGVLTAYYGEGGSVVVPDGVTRVGGNVFSFNESITKVVFPNSVKEIEEGAFFGCTNLTSADLPDTVTSIGNGSFHNCYSLTSINLPNGLTSIGDYLFANCSSLPNITIPDGVTSIGKGAFEGCTSLPNITIPDGVTSIGRGAFEGCASLKSITLPNGIECIEMWTFQDCSSLEAINIPDSVTSIDYTAFSNSGKLTIYCSSDAEYIMDYAVDKRISFCGDVQYTVEGTTLVSYNRSGGSVSIPEGVKVIGKEAFSRSWEITEIKLPQAVAIIEYGAFSGCESLVSISMPGVKKIGANAFWDCSSLKDITIPDTVTTLQDSLFRGCKSLVSVNIPESVTSIGESTFSDCSSLSNITIPSGVTEIEWDAFENCSNLKNITLPENLSRIGGNAFYNCSKLENITIPNDVEYIGYSAFSDCSSLTEVVIPSSVTELGEYAFAGCKNLTKITIPDSVTNIGESVFEGAYKVVIYCNANNSYVINYAKEWEIPYVINSIVISSIKLNKNEVTIHKGDTFTIIASISPTNATNQEIKWSSSDPGIAIVDDFGCITAISEGTAVITASATDGSSVTETCIVTVSLENLNQIATENISLSGYKFTYNGKPHKPSVTVKLGNSTLVENTDYTVEYWLNTDAGTAYADVTGKGKYIGGAVIPFTIEKATPKLTLIPDKYVIAVGEEITVMGGGHTSPVEYTYYSSDPSIFNVYSVFNWAKAKKPGIVTVTVKTPETQNYKAGSKSVVIKVVIKKPGNCHFVKWNNSKYTNCRIAWKKVDGAEGYQTLLSWTDGSHASQTIVKPNVLYRDCTVVSNHVSQMKVRGFYTENGKRVYGPWSNVEYITPSPAKLTSKNVSSGSNLKMNIKWNIIYGCNGYNVFITTNPNGNWYWNQSTSTKATATNAVINKYRGSGLKKNTRYYVRIVTRRKRNGVFCTVPMPANNTYIGSFVIN